MRESFSIYYIFITIGALLSIFWGNKKQYFYLFSIVLILICILRGLNVGTDYYNYYLAFESAKEFKVSLDRVQGAEPGFSSIMYVFKYFSNNYVLFYGLVFIVYFWCIFHYVNYKKVDRGWAIFLFIFLGYYFMSYNILRQLMTIGLIISFIPLLYKRKYTHFALVVIIFSFLFHRSEIEMLLLIPIYYLSTKIQKLNKPILYVIIWGSFALFYIGKSYLYDSFYSVINILNLDDQYGGYISRAENRLEIGNKTSLLFSLFATLIVFCKKNNTYIFETLCVIISYALFNIGNLLATQSVRIFLDFNIFIIVLIPLMIQENIGKYRKLIVIGSVFLCLFYYSYSYIINNRDEVNPYYFFFNSPIEMSKIK